MDSSSSPLNLLLLASSYQGRVIGVTVHLSKSQAPRLKVAFNSKLSQASLKAVAMHGDRVMACGGAEEVVKIVDIESKMEKALLVHHKGSIVKIIEADSHLLVGSSDGDISIWKLVSHDWTMVRTLSTANSAVKCMSLHSSKRMLLSVSDKNILRLWNLMNCRCIHRTLLDPSLYSNVIDVQWLNEGPSYAILCSHLIKINEAEQEIPPFQFQSSLECLIPLSSGELLLGGEKGLLCVLNYKTKNVQYYEVPKIGRIKNLRIIRGYVVLISTSGIIGGFQQSILKEEQEREDDVRTVDLQFELDTHLRLLSLIGREDTLNLTKLLKKRKKV